MGREVLLGFAHFSTSLRGAKRRSNPVFLRDAGLLRYARNDGTKFSSHAVIFASAASKAAAAPGRSLKASPLSADCFCVSVAVGRISATGFAPSSRALGAIT